MPALARYGRLTSTMEIRLSRCGVLWRCQLPLTKFQGVLISGEPSGRQRTRNHEPAIESGAVSHTDGISDKSTVLGFYKGGTT